MRVEWIIMAVGAALTYSTSPLMLYYALITTPTYPAVLVTLSSSFSSIAFILVALIFMFFRQKNRVRVQRTLLDPYNYLKMIILGILHVGVPSFLFLYAIQWLPPIVPGAFMALVPFWTALFDRFPCVQRTSTLTKVLRSTAILVGFIGVGATVVPTIYEMISNNCTCNASAVPPSLLTCINKQRTQACGREPLFYFMALGFCFLASLSWSASAVLWKRYGNEIHYTVGGSLMQVIGTISGITVWALVDGFKGFPNKIDNSNLIGFIGFIYAGVLLAFLTTLATFALYHQMGPINTHGLLILIPAVTTIEEYFLLREMKWATWSFIVTLVGSGLIIVAGLLSNSPLHDAIISRYDPSNPSSTKKAIYYEEVDRDQSNSTDVPVGHDNPYVSVPNQNSNDTNNKVEKESDPRTQPKVGENSKNSNMDQNSALEQLRSLDDKLQLEMATISDDNSKASESSNSRRATGEQIDDETAGAFVLALQQTFEKKSNSSSDSDSSASKNTPLPSTQISPSSSGVTRSPSSESNVSEGHYSLLSFPHRPNPYKNLTAKAGSSNTGVGTSISTFDQKSKPVYDRLNLKPVGASSIAQTVKPNPYQR